MTDAMRRVESAGQSRESASRSDCSAPADPSYAIRTRIFAPRSTAEVGSMAKSYVSRPEPPVTGARSSGSEIRRLAGSKHAHIELGYPPGGFVGKPVAGVERAPAPPSTPEARDVESAPMDRDGNRRPDEGRSIDGGRGVESCRPSGRTPPPDGQQCDIDVTGQTSHRRVDVCVPGEVH